MACHRTPNAFITSVGERPGFSCRIMPRVSAANNKYEDSGRFGSSRCFGALLPAFTSPPVFFFPLKEARSAVYSGSPFPSSVSYPTTSHNARWWSPAFSMLTISSAITPAASARVCTPYLFTVATPLVANSASLSTSHALVSPSRGTRGACCARNTCSTPFLEAIMLRAVAVLVYSATAMRREGLMLTGQQYVVMFMLARSPSPSPPGAVARLYTGTERTAYGGKTESSSATETAPYEPSSRAAATTFSPRRRAPRAASPARETFLRRCLD
mmetsp:Transcript_18137/g.45037  ORF Transcript_18137/g.45037 Transcript_18137/m.45037 type:complete len:271 (-) Transcript_18137:66-878(-)